MRALILAAVFISAATSSIAHVVENEVREFYEVRQSAGTSLLDAIDYASPIRKNGRVFHGYPAWDIRWKFWWNNSTVGLCEITSVTTSLSVKMTLPKLTTGTPDAKNQFENYIRALVAHEQGHRKIGFDAASEADRLIAGLRPMTNCQDLEREANRTGNAVLDAAKRRDIEYDVKTNYGCKQGACLPR